MKAKIIILMFPERGALNASFQLAKQLQNNGFDILYLVSEQYANHVENQKFDRKIFDLNCFYDQLIAEQEKIKQQHTSILRFLKLLSQWRSRNRRLETFLDDQFSWLDTEKADILLMDPILFNCSLPFLKRKIPVIHLNTTFASHFSHKILPVFSSKIPSKTTKTLNALVNFFLWSQLYINAIRKDLMWHVKYGLRPTRTINTIKKYIKKHGGKTRWSEYGFRLKTKELVLASAKLEFPTHQTTLDHTYVGSCIYNERQEFEDTTSSVPSGKKLMYCSLGSYSHIWLKNNIHVFSIIIEAMKTSKDWDVVIQVGDISFFDEVELPEHIRIVKFINQLKVLKEANVAVTHVGCSSYKECAYTGTPMIILPWNNDGYGNSARAVFHQLGIRLDMKTLSSEKFAEALEQLMASQNIWKSVRKKQEELIAENDCRYGVAYIEQTLNVKHHESN